MAKSKTLTHNEKDALVRALENRPKIDTGELPEEVLPLVKAHDELLGELTFSLLQAKRVQLVFDDSRPEKPTRAQPLDE